MDPSKFDHIVIKGLPYHRGLSYGSQAKEKILESLDYYRTSPSFLPWSDCLSFVTENYLYATQKYFPSGFQEIRGIADGSGSKMEEIFILNARYELGRIHKTRQIEKHRQQKLRKCTTNENLPPTQLDTQPQYPNNECTGAVALKSATQHGEVLMGQNWDMHESILKNDTIILLEVHPDPSESISPFIVLTEVGQLGRSGMNGNGLGLVGMGLWSTGDILNGRDQTKYPDGWVPITLLRRMFLQAKTFPLGISAIFRTPRHVSANLLVGTREDEAINIELTPNKHFITNVPLDKEIYCHSNHFKSAQFMARSDVEDRLKEGSSFFRDRRLEKYLAGVWPGITEQSFETAFKDHVGWPNSVCGHATPISEAMSTHPGDMIVASVILNLTKGTMRICKGPPCKGVYREYGLERSLNATDKFKKDG